MNSDEKKFFLVSDIHGSDLVYRKLAKAAEFYGVKYIILAGDLTGKAIVPIIRLNDTHYISNFEGKNIEVDDHKLEEIIKKIRNSGLYYIIVSKEEYEELSNNPVKLKKEFVSKMISELNLHFNNISNKIKSTGSNLYPIPGNDDFPEISEFVNSFEADNVIPFDEKILNVDGVQLMGYGYSNITPWHAPRDRSEEEILNDLYRISQFADLNRLIAVIHVPPHGTVIDRAPKLTMDLKPIVNGGSIETESVGSTSVRKFLEESPPILGLHGHIHESAGIDYIRSNKDNKKVPVFNAGSEYNIGVLKGVIFTLKDKGVKNYVFTRG